MRYQIFYTAGAKRDLRSIYSYIAEELLVPDTAAGQVQRIMKEIRSLDEMPVRYRLYDDEPWYSLGLRFSRWTISSCFICLMKAPVQ